MCVNQYVHTLYVRTQMSQVCIRMNVCMNDFLYVCVYVCMNVCVCAGWRHTHTHTQ